MERVAGFAGQVVVAGAAVERVGGAAAIELVVAAPAERGQRHGEALRPEAVVAGTADGDDGVTSGTGSARTSRSSRCCSP